MKKTHSQRIEMHDGPPAFADVWDDNNLWVNHPGTGLRVGVGRNDDGQPFVIIVTENAVEPEVGGEPMLYISLNDADVYDVEPTGPTHHSLFHNRVTTTEREGR